MMLRSFLLLMLKEFFTAYVSFILSFLSCSKELSTKECVARRALNITSPKRTRSSKSSPFSQRLRFSSSDRTSAASAISWKTLAASSCWSGAAYVHDRQLYAILRHVVSRVEQTPPYEEEQTRTQHSINIAKMTLPTSRQQIGPWTHLVRMVLFGKLAISPFDLLFICTLVNP